LLAATYNPTQWTFSRWVMTSGADNMSIAVLVGLLLVVGYIIYVRATLRSIGVVGMMLVAAVTGAMLWVAYDLGWMSFENPTANTWVALGVLSFVLGIGLSWSHVRRRLSGQADMDDVDT
jgi:drug/metabolite transporter (DMT)-like permease